MDDLISRKTLSDRIDRCVWKSGIGIALVMDIRDIKALISVIPPVEAVPMEPLCKLLSDIHGAPCNHTDICGEICGDTCNPMMGDELCWRVFLTKWMEEQNETPD